MQTQKKKKKTGMRRTWKTWSRELGNGHGGIRFGRKEIYCESPRMYTQKKERPTAR